MRETAPAEVPLEPRRAAVTLTADAAGWIRGTYRSEYEHEVRHLGEHLTEEERWWRSPACPGDLQLVASWRELAATRTPFRGRIGHGLLLVPSVVRPG